MTRKLVVEAIGTFFLMFTILMVVSASPPAPLAALAIGSVLMVMVYAGGHISGAHYNPAVTLAVFIRGKATAAEIVPYWIAQILGASAAALIAKSVFSLSAPPPAVPDAMPAAVAEFLFTFALAYVVLNVATTRGNEGNSYYGLAIGFTVLSGALAVGGVSGGVFNPAVAIGAVVFGGLAPAALPIYLVAIFAGAVLAAFLFRALDLGNDKPTTATPAQQGELSQPASTGR
ncbi:MAG TPA: aquaporin [Longimicrobiales bacterium]|nr:aquaporin [Longimicrobiales bacterium]